MSNRTIPVVDLGQFVSGNETDRKAFVEEIGDAFHHIGFVGVKNHGVPAKLIDDFFKLSYSFFALPTDVKMKYKQEGAAGQRGYTAFGQEHAKQSEVADLKEFFQIGQESVVANPKVEDHPEFMAKGLELYRHFERSGGALLRAIALHLGLDEFYFDRYIDNGNSILRSIHYPPIKSEPKSAIRAEQHEDINLITLLVGASAGGLQLFNKNGEWKDIKPEERELVINVGDMLQRLTNNYLKSTTHRVVNPPRELWHTPRLSIPFFLHPQSDMDLTCLDSCITDENPKQYTNMTAGEYLDERLREIGLKK